MDYTEEEAKKKYCPFAMSAPYEHGRNCIASDCMSWEFLSETGYFPSDKKEDGNGNSVGLCRLINPRKD